MEAAHAEVCRPPEPLLSPSCQAAIHPVLEEQEVYAFFVGEAAYYEPSKDIAFMLARKETLAVSLPAEVSK